MVDLLMTGLAVYGALGLAVALVFVVWGFDRVDAAAHGAYAMRPLLIPGLVMLWPVVLVRWITLARGGSR